MAFLDTVKLALYICKRGLALLEDAWGDYTGNSLPYDPAAVCEARTLAKLINAYPVATLAGPARIKTTQVQPIPSVSSNCVNTILSIEQEDEAILPPSLFVKLPMAPLATRWFFSVIGSWQLETWFCRQLEQHVPLRTPKTYAACSQGSRFFLVQENLREDPSVRLFTNPDMIEGASIAIAFRALDALARLHACHVQMPREQQLKLLPLDNHPFLSSQLRAVSRNLNRLALAPCMKKLPGHIPDSVASTYRKTQQHWDALLGHWFAGPWSMLHGDSHLGNFFVSGEDMGMLDFQAVHWGNGIRDVQYFLIDSLPQDLLAANEQDLLRYYLERRAHYGAPLDFEQSWQSYRSFSYHALMTIVVSIGFGALNAEQNVLMETLLARAVSAVQRVDYAGWLDEFLEA